METMFMQNFGGTNKEHYGIFESGLCEWEFFSFFFFQALQAAIKNLTASIRKRKEKIVAMQTALELDSEVSSL